MFTKLLTAISFAVLLLAPLISGAQDQAQQRPSSSSAKGKSPRRQPAMPDLTRAKELIVERTNAFRKENKLPELASNKALTDAAQYFADYMAEHHKYGHEADGNTPAARAEKYGYEYCLVLENIAYQYSSEGFSSEALAEAFVQGWEKSPGHRENMLNPYISQLGVGVSRGKTGYYFGVQVFGRPRLEQIEFSISNRGPAAVRYMLHDDAFDLPPRFTRTHQVCLPPEVELWPAAEGEEKPEKNVLLLRPQPGSRYVIEQDASGKIKARTE